MTLIMGPVGAKTRKDTQLIISQLRVFSRLMFG